MKLTTTIGGVAAALIAIAGVVWAVTAIQEGSRPDERTSGPTQPLIDHNPLNPFPLPDSPPFPRVAIDEMEHKFGRMLVGTKASHQFVVRNNGDAPLQLAVGPTSCKCTIGDLSDERLAPGDAAEVVLTWDAVQPTLAFSQWAVIFSNDPDLPDFKLRVSGEIVTEFMFDPQTPWFVGEVRGKDPVVIQGKVFSQFHQGFRVSGIRTDADWLSVREGPMNQEDLELWNVLSGYSLQCEVNPSMPYGAFNGTIEIDTDAIAEPVRVNVTGIRASPLQILSKGWNSRKCLLDLGRVNSREGKSVSMMVLSPKQRDPLELIDVICNPDILEISLEKDEAFEAETKDRYHLNLVVPTDGPTGRWRGEDAVRVELHLDGLGEVFRFSVELEVF